MNEFLRKISLMVSFSLFLILVFFDGMTTEKAGGLLIGLIASLIISGLFSIADAVEKAAKKRTWRY